MTAAPHCQLPTAYCQLAAGVCQLPTANCQLAEGAPNPADHIGLVGWFCSRRAVPGMRLEDLNMWSDACVGLMDACRKFDPSRGNSLSTFAKWCMRSAVTAGAKLRKKYLDRYQVTDQIGRTINRTDTTDLDLQAAADDTEWLDWAIAQLPSRWKPIIEQRRAGMSIRQMALGMHVSGANIRDREAEALRYLRNLAQRTCS